MYSDSDGTANAHISRARERFKITDDSLLAIRAEMPTENEQWKVESVVQYRCQYGTEQWLVKWKDYGEDRNTWEPWEHLGASRGAGRGATSANSSSAS